MSHHLKFYIRLLSLKRKTFSFEKIILGCISWFISSAKNWVSSRKYAAGTYPYLHEKCVWSEELIFCTRKIALLTVFWQYNENTFSWILSFLRKERVESYVSIFQQTHCLHKMCSQKTWPFAFHSILRAIILDIWENTRGYFNVQLSIVLSL